MDANERNALLTAYVTGVGATATLPYLCRILRRQEIISAEEAETLRHFALVSFDQLSERLSVSEEEMEMLGSVREHVDAMWHRVSNPKRSGE